MSGLARLFCFSGGQPGGREDWRSRTAHSGDTYAKAKVLDFVADEVDQRFARLHTQHVNRDAVPIRRLYKANLPAPEMNAAVDVLGKLCSIDDARESAETDCKQLLKALKGTEAALRKTEFSKARAEALATARGEALMHAQQATRDAEAQQAQLTEVLRSALQQLGLALTPEKSPAPTPSGLYDRLATGERPPAAKQAAQESAQQAQQEERVSATRGARASWHGGDGAAAAPRPHPHLARHSAAPAPGPQGFTGFTVYTNQLGSPEYHAAAGAAWQEEEEEEGAGAAREGSIRWRDISEAALSESSRSEAGLSPAAGGSGAWPEPSQGGAAALRPAPLILPHADAPRALGQPDSLVHVGASLASPNVGPPTSGYQAAAGATGPPSSRWLAPRAWAALQAGPRRGVGAGGAAALPSPNPTSHIKAMFTTKDDLQFYLPFSAGMQQQQTAAPLPPQAPAQAPRESLAASQGRGRSAAAQPAQANHGRSRSVDVPPARPRAASLVPPQRQPVAAAPPAGHWRTQSMVMPPSREAEQYRGASELYRSEAPPQQQQVQQGDPRQQAFRSCYQPMESSAAQAAPTASQAGGARASQAPARRASRQAPTAQANDENDDFVSQLRSAQEVLRKLDAQLEHREEVGRGQAAGKAQRAAPAPDRRGSAPPARQSMPPAPAPLAVANSRQGVRASMH